MKSELSIHARGVTPRSSAVHFPDDEATCDGFVCVTLIVDQTEVKVFIDDDDDSFTKWADELCVLADALDKLREKANPKTLADRIGDAMNKAAEKANALNKKIV